jgi:hypothetical protein
MNEKCKHGVVAVANLIGRVTRCVCEKVAQNVGSPIHFFVIINT